MIVVALHVFLSVLGGDCKLWAEMPCTLRITTQVYWGIVTSLHAFLLWGGDSPKLCRVWTCTLRVTTARL